MKPGTKVRLNKTSAYWGQSDDTEGVVCYEHMLLGDRWIHVAWGNGAQNDYFEGDLTVTGEGGEIPEWAQQSRPEAFDKVASLEKDMPPLLKMLLLLAKKSREARGGSDNGGPFGDLMERIAVGMQKVCGVTGYRVVAATPEPDKKATLSFKYEDGRTFERVVDCSKIKDSDFATGIRIDIDKETLEITVTPMMMVTNPDNLPAVLPQKPKNPGDVESN
jgi:hypothetical protein